MEMEQFHYLHGLIMPLLPKSVPEVKYVNLVDSENPQKILRFVFILRYNESLLIVPRS